MESFPKKAIPTFRIRIPLPYKPEGKKKGNGKKTKIFISSLPQ